MSELPRSPDDLLAQCNASLQAARAVGKVRLGIDVQLPGLEVLTLLASLTSSLGEGGWAAGFPDPGAAALARRSLGEVAYALRGISEFRTGLEQYSALVLVEPSAVEVEAVEALAGRFAGRPLIILNSRLSEAGVVGIGLTGRQLRDRFLSTIEPVYAVLPFEGGALFRAYPHRWQVWREDPAAEGGFARLGESDNRPTGEEIDRLFAPTKGEGLFAGLRRFLRVLGQ